MIMKKILMSLLVVILILACSVALFACGPKEEVKEIDLSEIGKKAPEASVVGDKVEAISASMTGEQMMIAAVNNFYKANYTGVYQVGNVTTKMLSGVLTVKQAVEGLRIKDGDNMFMYNNSYTAEGPSFVNVRVMENYYVNGADGSIKLLSSGDAKNVDIVDGKLTAKAWPIDQKFANKDEYLKSNPNDPTRLFMYIINEDTISSTTDPVDKGDYYEFDVVCDAPAAFKDYVPVMKYMLDQSVSGAQIKEDGMALSFKVQIWKQGLFKEYSVKETYFMSIIKIINGSIDLISDVRFTYDKNEANMNKYFTNGDFVAKTQLAK